MKKQKIILCALLIFIIALLFCLPIFALDAKNDSLANKELYVGGMPFGAKIVSNGLTVVKFSETQGKNASSAYEAGIRQGDIIIKINDTKINTIEDFVKQIDKSSGNKLSITIFIILYLKPIYL